MMGAHCLLEMRARRSRRAFSISFKYSASTNGVAMKAGCEIIFSQKQKKKKKMNAYDRVERFCLD